MGEITKAQEITRTEIIEKRKEVTSDTLNFSVGEILNLYKDNELDLEPAFQRFFRWNYSQQTKFIESLILGYPVPSIFVFQKDDGVWEVIDGVQRISSLLNFFGLLYENGKDENIPLILGHGDILEYLNNRCCDEKNFAIILENKEKISKQIDVSKICPLDKATVIDLKRARIPVIVLSNKSERNSRLELFKRLNSGGSHLEPQEIRNALIYMTSREVFEMIKDISQNTSFRELIRLDANGEKLSFDMEVLTRYLILANIEMCVKYDHKMNAENYIDQSIEKIIKEVSQTQIKDQLDFFINLCEILRDKITPDYGFRNYDSKKYVFKGMFTWFIFEIVIYGALNNKISIEDDNFIKAIKNIKLDNIQGKKTLDRMLNISKKKSEEVFSFE